MLILGELIVKVFFRIFSPISLFRPEIFGNSESRHDRRMVDRVIFYFVEDFQRIAQGFRHIGKELIHLLPCFHPFLFGVKHTARIIQVLTGTQTNQAVMCFGIFFIHEVDVVRTNQLDVELLSVFHQVFVHIYLQWVTFVIGTGNSCLMALHLKIKIITEQILIPLYSFFSFRKLSGSNPFRYLTTEAGGADNQSFMILFEFAAVCTRTHIISARPRVRY